MAQDSFHWRALVNTLMNLPCPIKGRAISGQLSNYELLKKDSYPMSLITWSRVLEKLIITESKNSSSFMEPEASLSCSQEPASLLS
jgi:hypothetical protein